MEYTELKQEVIKIGLATRYDVICYLVALDIPIKASALHNIAMLVSEGVIAE